MISLSGAGVSGRKPLGLPLLWPTTIRFPERARIGILASPGSGKTTLARLFSGLEYPSTGQVGVQGNVSWPLGFAGFLHPELTLAQNLTVLARLKGVDPTTYIATCLAFADTGAGPRTKAQDLTPFERAVIAYSCAINLQWDYLIADETITVGDPILRMKCDAMIDGSKDTTGLIFLSRNPSQLRTYCDHFLVLIGGRLKPCPDLDAGNEALALVRDHSKESHAYV